MLRQAELNRLAESGFVTGISCQLFGQLHIEERETWRAALFRSAFGHFESKTKKRSRFKETALIGAVMRGQRCVRTFRCSTY